MKTARRVLKVLLVAFAVVFAAIALFAAVTIARFPPTFEVAPVDLAAVDDPEVIAEGAYLFHAAAHCGGCHVPMDVQRAATPGEYAAVMPVGGFELKFGPLGTLRGSNLTSDVATGIGGMSDTELAGIIRNAIRADGSPAYFMTVAPRMSDRDLVAIMSYLRSLPAVENVVEHSHLSPLGKILFSTVMRLMIEPSQHGWDAPQNVDAADAPSVARGEYLAWGPANCVACHSVSDPEDPWHLTRPFAGTSDGIPDEQDSSMMFFAPNLTTHAEFGRLATMTEDGFVARIRGGRIMEGSPMPWECYGHLTESDMRSLYLFLSSLEPEDFDVGPVHRPGGH